MPHIRCRWRALDYLTSLLVQLRSGFIYILTQHETWLTQQAKSAIKICHDLFPSVSVDLISGRHKQKPSEWKNELRNVLEHGCSHLSIYNLTIERGTKYHRLREEGKCEWISEWSDLVVILPDENESLEMYRDSRAICQEFGLQQYEVSSYGKEGHRSKWFILILFSFYSHFFMI